MSTPAATTLPHRNDTLLSATEAAAYLGVRPQTLAVWRSSKRYPDLHYIKVGQAVKYKRSVLDHWLELRTVGAAR